VIGSTEAEAEAKYRELAELGNLENACARWVAGSTTTISASMIPMARSRDVAAEGLKSNQSQSARVLALADQGLTLREIALRHATPRGQLVGTPEQVADRLQLWLEQRGADGFNLFESLPGQLETFVDEVVPILQRRGITKTEYPGTTFRETLGLDVPVNRHTAARSARSAA
jgi:alkanesulfonate monooxygenase SsuD/methylene tetrahydromethanopterin reductase-like flavin-dependent oxidoreductase (luciferase family)